MNRILRLVILPPLLVGAIDAQDVVQSWTEVVRVLRNGEALDLDDPDMPTRLDGVGEDFELRNVEGALRFLGRHAEDSAMARIEPGFRWVRVGTSRGRFAYVAALTREPMVVVRVVVERGGQVRPFPALRGLRPLWVEGEGVHLDFDADPGFASYVVDRIDGDGVERIGRFDAPPFVDRSAPPGQRFAYRVTGLSGSGDQGIPTSTAAASVGAPALGRGALHRGAIDLKPGEAVDLLLASATEEAGDLRFAGGAIVDLFGLEARATDVQLDASYWEAWDGGSEFAAASGARFVALLRGGGIALVGATPRGDGRLGLQWVAQPGAQRVGRDLLAQADAAQIGVDRPPTEAPPNLQLQEWLLGRTRHQDYEKATFSFEHGLRDDPDLRITLNDWDLQFGNSHEHDLFHVRMVRDDLSKIVDLGPGTWDELDVRAAEGTALVLSVPARLGHVYAVRTIDSETDRWSLFRVEVLRRGDSARISWVTFDDRHRLRTSPDVELDRGAQGRLTGLVTWLGERGGIRPFVHEGAAEDTIDKLEDTLLDGQPMTVGEALERVEAALGVEPEMSRGAQQQLAKLRDERLPYASHVERVEDGLELATRAIGWWWTIRPDGVLELGPLRGRRR